MNLSRLDLDGRDLLWQAVLACVASAPAELGRVIAQVERVCDDDSLTRHLAGFLQEMARGGHIRLINDGRRWTVALGPNGAATLARLEGRPRPSFTIGRAEPLLVAV